MDLVRSRGAHCQMCSGTHWSTLLHSCDGDNTMLPYQEWRKRALLGFYKLLFSKQTDTSETGMWKPTDNSTEPARVASFVTKSDWILSHCCHSKEWVSDQPVHESLIDIDFSWELTNNTTEFYCNAHCCDASLAFAMCLLRTFMYFLPFIPFCFTKVQQKSILIEMFLYGLNILFTEVLPEVSLLCISASGDAASLQNSRTLVRIIWVEDKVRTWRHSSLFNFCISSCSHSFNFLFPSHSYQCACFFLRSTCVSH